MLTIYGIPNCNSVKKTRDWLLSHQIKYVFHDFKKQGIDEASLRLWLKTIPLSELINKKGITWRGLSADEQAMANNQDSAVALMMSKTSVIKRPVVVAKTTLFVGHNEEQLQSLVSAY